MSLLDLASVLLRHRWLIIAFSVLTPAVIIVISLVLPREWTTVASFTPQSESQGISSRLANLAGQFGVAVPMGESAQSPQFYADLVRSREILGSVADSSFEVSDTVGLFRRGLVTGSLADVLNLERGEPPQIRRASAIEWLEEDAVAVSTNRETGVVEVSVVTHWPDLSVQIAEDIVALVNEFNLQTRQSQAAAERRFIEGRVEDARKDLRMAERALQTFLQNNRQFENSPELVFQHDRLQRAVAMRQQVYTSLVESLEEARIAEVRNTPVVTVVQPPEAPVRPDSRALALKAVLALGFGAFLGVFGALAREYGRRQRKEQAEDFAEFSEVWQDTKDELKDLFHHLGIGRSFQ